MSHRTNNNGRTRNRRTTTRQQKNNHKATRKEGRTERLPFPPSTPLIHSNVLSVDFSEVSATRALEFSVNMVVKDSESSIRDSKSPIKLLKKIKIKNK